MTDDLVLEYRVSTLRGRVEDVRVADGVDMDEIRRSDPDAMFVTLPIAEIGAVSNNGLLYDEALVNSIEEQINANRPGGIFGHLKEEERSTSFPLPAGLWIGAQRVAQTLWAKSYIPPGPARDYMGNLKKVGGQIATSIYGRGKRVEVSNGVHRRENFKLESLDFAPTSRAALGMGAVPHVTAEMDTEQEPIMADKAQVIAELTIGDIPAPLRDAIVAEASRQDDTAQTIAELNATKTAQDALISELNTQVNSYRLERLSAAIEARVAELTDWQVNDEPGKEKLKKLRALLRDQIVTRLGSDQKLERVAEISEAAWKDLEPLAEMIRDALAGPAAIVHGKIIDPGGRPKLEDTPANRLAALSGFQISV